MNMGDKGSVSPPQIVKTPNRPAVRSENVVTLSEKPNTESAQSTITTMYVENTNHHRLRHSGCHQSRPLHRCALLMWTLQLVVPSSAEV